MGLEELQKSLGTMHSALETFNSRQFITSQYYNSLKERKEIRANNALSYAKKILGAVLSVSPRYKFISASDSSRGYDLVTSSLGFMAGLDREVIRTFRASENERGQVELTAVIGEKGAEQMSLEEEILFIEDFDGTQKKLETKATELVKIIVPHIINSNIGQIDIFHPTRGNSSHSPYIIKSTIFSNSLFQIAPEIEDRELVVESDYKEILAYSLEKYFHLAFQDVLEDAKLAEYKARLNHLASNINGTKSQITYLGKAIKRYKDGVAQQEQNDRVSAELLRKKRKRSKERMSIFLSRMNPNNP